MYIFLVSTFISFSRWLINYGKRFKVLLSISYLVYTSFFELYRLNGYSMLKSLTLEQIWVAKQIGEKEGYYMKIFYHFKIIFRGTFLLLQYILIRVWAHALHSNIIASLNVVLRCSAFKMSYMLVYNIYVEIF